MHAVLREVPAEYAPVLQSAGQGVLFCSHQCTDGCYVPSAIKHTGFCRHALPDLSVLSLSFTLN